MPRARASRFAPISGSDSRIQLALLSVGVEVYHHIALLGAEGRDGSVRDRHAAVVGGRHQFAARSKDGGQRQHDPGDCFHAA